MRDHLITQTRRNWLIFHITPIHVTLHPAAFFAAFLRITNGFGSASQRVSLCSQYRTCRSDSGSRGRSLPDAITNCPPSQGSSTHPASPDAHGRTPANPLLATAYYPSKPYHLIPNPTDSQFRDSNVPVPIAFDSDSAPSASVRGKPKICTTSAKSIIVFRCSRPHVVSNADSDCAKHQIMHSLTCRHVVTVHDRLQIPQTRHLIDYNHQVAFQPRPRR